MYCSKTAAWATTTDLNGRALLLRSLAPHKNGLRIKQTRRGLGKTAGRQRRCHRHAGSPAASRTRAQVRTAQLAHQNRQYGRCAMTKARAKTNAIRMPGKERPAASRLVIQKPPTRSLTIGISAETRNPPLANPSGKPQRVSITDSFGASPVSSALDHSARRDPGRASTTIPRNQRV